MTTSKLRALAQSARANAVRRRNGQGGATTTYIKAGVGDVARVLSTITGEPHPFAGGAAL